MLLDRTARQIQRLERERGAQRFGRGSHGDDHDVRTLLRKPPARDRTFFRAHASSRALRRREIEDRVPPCGFVNALRAADFSDELSNRLEQIEARATFARGWRDQHQERCAEQGFDSLEHRELIDTAGDRSRGFEREAPSKHRRHGERRSLFVAQKLPRPFDRRLE